MYFLLLAALVAFCFSLCHDGPDKGRAQFHMAYVIRSTAAMQYLFTDRLVILYSDKQTEGCLG